MESEEHYAKVAWSPEDIQELRPGWTIEKCAEWLGRNDLYISDRIEELGREEIKSLLEMEDE